MAIAWLKKVATTGRSPAKLLRMDGSARGAAWADGNSIVLATSSLTIGLQRISADGGEATVLTRPDPKRGELDHVWPERLPEGRGVLFTVLSTGGALDAARIAVLETATGSGTTVMAGHHARYVPTGHLVYVEAGALRAVSFVSGAYACGERRSPWCRRCGPRFLARDSSRCPMTAHSRTQTFPETDWFEELSASCRRTDGPRSATRLGPSEMTAQIGLSSRNQSVGEVRKGCRQLHQLEGIAIRIDQHGNLDRSAADWCRHHVALDLRARGFRRGD